MVQFIAVLDGTQEVPAVGTSAGGAASAVLTADGKSLKIKVSAAGLSGPITSAHIHKAAQGLSGAPIKDLTFTADGNTTTLTWTDADATAKLDAATITELRAGNLYVNLHTAANNGGEIRGQLLPTGTALSGVINAAQEVPAGTSLATGSVAAALSVDQKTLTLDIALTKAKLSGAITMAHIHNGLATENGPDVKTLTFDENGKLRLAWTAADATDKLTGDLITALLAGKLYVNVHTAGSPDGEIRGQITAP